MSLTHHGLRARFVLRRVVGTVVTLVLLATIVFFLVKLIPGDEARVAAGPSATPAQVAVVGERLGLNRSVGRQFFGYLGRTAHLDLGKSTATNESVARGILRVLPATLELVLLTIAVIVIVAVPAATVSAVRSGRRFDRLTRVSVVFGSALPTFWVALIAQYWLGSRLHLLPISGELSRGVTVRSRTGSVLVDAAIAGDGSAFADAAKHVLLPVAVLAVSFGAQFFRALRAEMLQVLSTDFVTVARAKGMSEARLAFSHVLPNAGGPALTVLGVLFGNMVGGAILVETVFGLAGIGSYLTNAVAHKDLFAVLGGALFIGLLVVAANLLVDVAQLLRDPRLRAAEFGS